MHVCFIQSLFGDYIMFGLKVDLDPDNSAVVVQVVDRDDNNKVVAERPFSAARVHESIRGKVALYGLSKLIQDRTSDKSVKEHGEGKLEFMEAVLARLETGEWAAERTAGAPTVSAEVEALAAIKGVSIAAIQKSLRAFSKENRQGILANEQVVAKAAEIKAARATADDVDLSEML